MNLLSKAALLEDVIKDEEAIQFHAQQFIKGHRYILARQCFVILEERKNDNSRA